MIVEINLHIVAEIIKIVLLLGAVYFEFFKDNSGLAISLLWAYVLLDSVDDLFLR